jgi:hypothetical protein
MIEYIVRDNNGLLEICEDGLIFKVDSSLMGLLNLWSNHALRSVETTLRTTQKLLNCRHKIPLYINSNMLFLQLRTIRSKTPFLINYFAIAKLLPNRHNETTIFFKSGVSVNFDSIHTTKRQLDLSKVILESLESNTKNKKVFT